MQSFDDYCVRCGSDKHVGPPGERHPHLRWCNLCWDWQKPIPSDLRAAIDAMRKQVKQLKRDRSRSRSRAHDLEVALLRMLNGNNGRPTIALLDAAALFDASALRLAGVPETIVEASRKEGR